MPQTLRAKCLYASQRLARLEAADDLGYVSCVSCGKSDHYKNMQGGHFIPKGRSSFWALAMENINPQCPGCNKFGMAHGVAAQQYTRWMEDKHGVEFVDYMLANKNRKLKMGKKDYEELLAELNSKIKYHESRVGG